jgi:hypothetical protein
MSNRLVATTLGAVVIVAADQLAREKPAGWFDDFPLRTPEGELNNIHLHRDLVATMALTPVMDQFGIAELWDDLNSDPEAFELLLLALVCKSGKTLGAVSRRWRQLGGSVQVPEADADEAAAYQIPVWYEYLGRACTKLGLLEPLSIAGYRHVFEP